MVTGQALTTPEWKNAVGTLSRSFIRWKWDQRGLPAATNLRLALKVTALAMILWQITRHLVYFTYTKLKQDAHQPRSVSTANRMTRNGNCDSSGFIFS